MTAVLHTVAKQEPAPKLAPDPPPSAPQPGAKARDIRRRRGLKLALRLALGVGLPTALGAVYYGAVASDEFDSVALFTVHAVDSRANISVETLIGAIPGMTGARDGLAVSDYILSRDMLERLDREHKFIAHYKSSGADFWSRLPADASREDAYEYYLDKVQVTLDTNSGVLTLEVRAYSADKANTFAKAILGYSEEMVNKMSERARRDQIRFASEEVATAEKRLTKARQALLEVQQERGELNPEATATAAVTLRTGLEAQLAKARADLMQLQSYMQPDAPQVIAAQGRVSALGAQVANESRRLVNPKGEHGLNATMAQFEGAALEKEFAQSAYEHSLASLELARHEASRQHRYLATIAKPSVPDESTHPVRWLGVLTIGILSFFGFGILSLVVASIKEHARL